MRGRANLVGKAAANQPLGYQRTRVVYNEIIFTVGEAIWELKKALQVGGIPLVFLVSTEFEQRLRSGEGQDSPESRSQEG